MRDILIDCRGKGLRDSSIALCKQDSAVFRFIPDMRGAEHIRVRPGVTALVELAPPRGNELRTAVLGLTALLIHKNPTIRGDAIAVLGIIKDQMSLSALKMSFRDDHPGVRGAARDALAEMGR